MDRREPALYFSKIVAILCMISFIRDLAECPVSDVIMKSILLTASV